MKKLISFVIATMMLLIISARAEEAEIGIETETKEAISANMQKKVDILSAIDILRGYEDGSFRLNQKITRAEFAVLAVRTLGYEDIVLSREENNLSFVDIEGHWAVENIEFAKSLGLFSGSDGYFYPDNYITGNEAIKVMVCMLGYGNIAESEGGWPKGYYKIATNLGILKEVEDGYLTTETVNRSFVIAALFNTLNTSALGVDLSSGTVNYTPNGETILENVHKVYNSNGKITATKYTDLYSNRRGTKDGTVVIGEDNYYAGTTNAHDLIGYNVEFYYRTEGMDDYKTLIYITPRSMCAEKVIQASEIDKVEGSRLYYGASGRSVEIEKSALVFYNKRAYPDYSVNDLKIDDGELKFLDSDGNGKYDIIFINEFINIVLGTVNNDNMKLMDYFNPSKSVELNPKGDADEMIYTIVRNGEEVEFSKLSKFDVLSVYMSKDSRIVDIVAVNNALEGTVTEISNENGRNVVVIDDKKYTVTNDCNGELTIGTSYVIYLNHKDEIAGFETKNAPVRFAYLIRVKKNREDDSLLLKILDSDGKIKMLPTRSKVTIDGETKKGSLEVKNALKRNGNYSTVDNYYTAALASGNEDAYDYTQLLLIKTNANNEITQIMTEKPYNNYLTYAQRQASPEAKGYTEEELCDLELGYNGLCRHNLDPIGTGYTTPGIYFTTNRKINEKNYIRYNTNMNSIEGKIAITSKTKFFILNTDINNDEKYSVASGSGFSNNEQVYQGNIQVYNMNKANEAMAIVLVKGANADVATPLFLVDKLITGLNSDDEVANIIVGLYGGEKVAFPCREDVFAKDSNGNYYERGDIIRISLTDNEIINSEIKVDFSNKNFERSSPSKFDDNDYYDVGKVYNISDGKITLATGTSTKEYVNRRSYPIAGNIYVYDQSEKSVYIGSVSDIEDYAHYHNVNAMACVHMSYGKMTGLVYYK